MLQRSELLSFSMPNNLGMLSPRGTESLKVCSYHLAAFFQKAFVTMQFVYKCTSDSSSIIQYEHSVSVCPSLNVYFALSLFNSCLHQIIRNSSYFTLKLQRSELWFLHILSHLVSDSRLELIPRVAYFISFGFLPGRFGCSKG